MRHRQLYSVVLIVGVLGVVTLFRQRPDTKKIQQQMATWKREFLQSGDVDKDTLDQDFEIAEKVSGNMLENQKSIKQSGGTVNEKGPIPIILLTYMRSGSTFVGDILQADPDTYYMFEPLHRLQFTMRDKKPIRYINGTVRFYDNFLDPAATMVKNMATCNVDGVPIPVFEDGFFPYTAKARPFRACVDSREIHDLQKARNCIHILNEACMSSTHLVFKIIRAPMSLFDTMMKEIPKMKIVHLLRDPRATLYSQNKAGVVNNQLLEHTKKYCNRVYSDSLEAEELKQRFPGRVMTVDFEDITEKPMEMTRKLYQFANLKFTEKVAARVTSLTSPKEVRDKSYADSATRAWSWRTSIPMEFVRVVDSTCQQLYYKLGLNEIPDEVSLRNFNFNIRPNPPSFDDFRYA